MKNNIFTKPIVESKDVMQITTDQDKFFHPYKIKVIRRPIKYDERLSEKYFVHNVLNTNISGRR